MLKKTQLTHRGINQDISNSKRDPGFYYDANNIRILATEDNTTGSISNDRGTELKFSIAQGYTIIGHSTIKNYIVLFCTDSNNLIYPDIIYRINLDDNILIILFRGKLNFNPIDFLNCIRFII